MSIDHNKILWVVQWVFGLYFIGFGILHLVLPEGLPDPVLGWMYDLDPSIHLISGVAEILGGLGLILPGLTGIAPNLVPLAAVGLLLIMLGAIVFHYPREEWLNIGINLFDAAFLGYIAYGRWRLAPFESRSF